MHLGSPTLTFLHVLISVVGLISGLVVACGFFGSKRLDGWNTIFLWSTILTSLTGFLFFPFHKITPGHIVGAISLVILGVALVARSKKFSGIWRAVYVIAAMMAFYLNTFVLIVQLFMKIPSLHELAPTGTEGPFKVTQLVVLAIFLFATIACAFKFRPDPVRTA